MYYANQFAYDNAEPDDYEIADEVYEQAEEEFAADWLCYTEFSDATMVLLTKLAQGKKLNDLEMHSLKTGMNHAYEVALEHYCDDNIERIEKQMIADNNSI